MLGALAVGLKDRVPPRPMPSRFARLSFFSRPPSGPLPSVAAICRLLRNNQFAHLRLHHRFPPLLPARRVRVSFPAPVSRSFFFLPPSPSRDDVGSFVGLEKRLGRKSLPFARFYFELPFSLVTFFQTLPPRDRRMAVGKRFSLRLNGLSSFSPRSAFLCRLILRVRFFPSPWQAFIEMFLAIFRGTDCGSACRPFPGAIRAFSSRGILLFLRLCRRPLPFENSSYFSAF